MSKLPRRISQDTNLFQVQSSYVLRIYFVCKIHVKYAWGLILGLYVLNAHNDYI